MGVLNIWWMQIAFLPRHFNLFSSTRFKLAFLFTFAAALFAQIPIHQRNISLASWSYLEITLFLLSP